MAFNPLVLIGGAALGYFTIIKPDQDRKKRASQAATATPAPATPDPATPDPNRPWIVFGPECTWSIPSNWWTDVANPKFKELVGMATSGLSGADSVNVVKELNSHAMMHALLQGESPASCPLPAADVDLMDTSALDDSQTMMVNLMAHVLPSVEGGLIGFVQSQGTKLSLALTPELPEDPGTPPGQWPPVLP